MTNYRTMTGIITKIQIPTPSRRKTMSFYFLANTFETWQDDTQGTTVKKNSKPVKKHRPPEHFLHLDNKTWRRRGRSLNKFPMAQASTMDEKHTMREWSSLEAARSSEIQYRE